MTVVVWDGSTLATDVAATDGAAQWQTEKAWVFYNELGKVILSGSGPLHSILEMRDWFKAGARSEDFPAIQITHPCHFIMVNTNGLQRYEQHPVPINHGRNKCAFGEGRDFAYGALYMGATSEQAVEAANEHSVHCGLGVKLYTLGDNYVGEEDTYTV